MKTPKRLLPLLEEGFIDEVTGQLMSGKGTAPWRKKAGEALVVRAKSRS